MENKPSIVPKEIRNLIYTIRGKQVMLDSDLAALYQVETKNLNKAVKRNIERFPVSFCFQLTEEEVENLRFQIGTSSLSYGGSGVWGTREQQPCQYGAAGGGMGGGRVEWGATRGAGARRRRRGPRG